MYYVWAKEGDRFESNQKWVRNFPQRVGNLSWKIHLLTLPPLSLPKGRYVHIRKSLWPVLNNPSALFLGLVAPSPEPPFPCQILQTIGTLSYKCISPLNSLLRFIIFYVVASGIDFGQYPFVPQLKGSTILYLRCSAGWWVWLPNYVNLDVRKTPFGHLCSCAESEIFHVGKEVASKCRAVFLLGHQLRCFCFYW